MRYRNLKPYVMIVSATLIVDWILGALCASGSVPLWGFLVANFPFGGFYVWMESSWVDTHYVILGHRIGDIGSLVIFGTTVLAQAFLYCFLWSLIQGRQERQHKEIQPTSGFSGQSH